MSEETEEQTPETPAETPPPATDKPPSSRQIRAEVAERLGSIGEAVRGNVVDALYKKEEDRRTAAVLKVVEDIDSKERELNKLSHGDVTTFEDAEGKVPTKRFSPERVKARKALIEEIGKLNAKLNAALEKGDWSKLLG